ncbi:MAG: LysR family transcriptional regulator, partial [Rubrivivax sp.]|nr:LysR family transcriptional regulator [Rubrivivax sp.]
MITPRKPKASASDDAALPALTAAMSRLRLRHLQLLDALDRLGSLRQVALALGIKQPATLSLIDDLEFAVGIPLVVRERSGTTLTPAARTLLARARIAIQEVALAGQLALRSASSGGRLRVGASPYLINALLPAVVAQLRGQSPGLEIDIHEGTLYALVAELVKGELDAVLGSVDQAAVLSSAVSLDASFLVAEPMCIVAGSGHRLFARGQATLAEVLAGPWALPHVNSHLRGLIDSAVFDQGAAPIAPA